MSIMKIILAYIGHIIGNSGLITLSYTPLITCESLAIPFVFMKICLKILVCMCIYFCTNMWTCAFWWIFCMWYICGYIWYFYYIFLLAYNYLYLRGYCSGLAGEIDRPQVLFYPLIEFSNIPRYNWYENMDKVILCVAICVSRTVLTFSTGSFKLH